MHKLPREVTVEIDGFTPFVTSSPAALLRLQEALPREMPDQLLLGFLGEAPEIAGLDDEPHEGTRSGQPCSVTKCL